MWTQDDADLAIALLEVEADECPGCGVPRAESMAPESEFRYTVEPVRCHACAAREREATRLAKDDGWDDAGISWLTVTSDLEVSRG